ncbi:hypothetical protein [Thalassospira sp. HJ]|uniref:hypothetical protein n=1 Tax=Thalassospira sp. HJ TaxID=1616823 RepID=UPI000698ED65|nr:hypothetical protein [Thalassospira sp. HJ]
MTMLRRDGKSKTTNNKNGWEGRLRPGVGAALVLFLISAVMLFAPALQAHDLPSPQAEEGQADIDSQDSFLILKPTCIPPIRNCKTAC